jgi:hypothetical protein
MIFSKGLKTVSVLNFSRSGSIPFITGNCSRSDPSRAHFQTRYHPVSAIVDKLPNKMEKSQKGLNF